MQPQGHVQVMVNGVDYGMNPQTSLDAPRWQWLGGKEVALEVAVPRHVMDGLEARGHVVSVRNNPGSFGRGQIIRRLPGGALRRGERAARRRLRGRLLTQLRL